MKSFKRCLLGFVFFCGVIFRLQAQTWDWVQTIRPGGNDYCWDVAMDKSGNILATGRVKGNSTFGSGIYTQSPPFVSCCETDVFVAKYRANGNLVWVKRQGGKQADWGRDICSDNLGNVFVTGDYSDTANFGAHQIVGVGSVTNRNVFLAKYDSMGVCLWAKTAGNANGLSKGYGVTTDDAGNCYLTGNISGAANFDGVNFGNNGFNNPFVAKFSPGGNCIWAQRLPVSLTGEGYSICVDKSGNLLIAGAFRGVIYLGNNTYTSNSSTWEDVFLVKMSNTGTILWSAVAIGGFQDQAYVVDTDDDENVYVGGTFANDLKFGATVINSEGTGGDAASANAGIDAFLAKYDKNGTFKWVKTIGNKSSVTLDDLEITASGKLLIEGSVIGPQVTIFGEKLNIVDSLSISVIAELDTDGNVLWRKLDYKAGDVAVPRGVCSDIHGNCFIGGEFIADPFINFDSIVVQCYSGVDGYIAKLFPPLDPVLVPEHTAVCPGDSVYFSVKQDGYPLAYQWSFPGAQPATSTLQRPRVVYPTIGVYTATLIISNPHGSDTTSVTIEATPAACATALADNNGKVEVKIFPNPASSVVTILADGVSNMDAQQLSLELFDVLGRKMEITQMIANNAIILNVENLVPGSYYMNVIKNNAVIKAERLLIQR